MKHYDIVCAGNLVADYVKVINAYPKPGELSTIVDIYRSSGGAVPNVLIDLAKVDSTLKLYAIGLVGGDENGRYLVNRLNEYGIDVSGVRETAKYGTSFTDVYSVEGGERTFFHYRGANMALSFENFDFGSFTADILHIGYALLLDSLDAPDSEYGTVMAKTLCAAQKAGLKTSLDVVSENSDRFAKIVPWSLKYTDYFIANEMEASLITGISVRDKSGRLLVDNIKSCCLKLFELKVGRWVIIHAPEAGFGMDRTSGFHIRPSYDLPEGYIKGTVGAGDAFCAGVLYAIHKNWDIAEALKLGAGAACLCLSDFSSTEGVRSLEEITDFCSSLPLKKID